jgi:hypothetical protein
VLFISPYILRHVVFTLLLVLGTGELSQWFEAYSDSQPGEIVKGVFEDRDVVSHLWYK